MRKTALFLALICVGAAALSAQGLVTTAKQNDWEEINFESGSTILSDGYPSMIRLAGLLSSNPHYRAELTGHTDFVGDESFNLLLGRRRAEAVKEFLVSNGVDERQILVKSRGQESPKVGNETVEGRFMNRRVVIVVKEAESVAESEETESDEAIEAQILEFSSNKPTLRKPGDPSVLSWRTENATRVTLTNLGDVPSEGSVTVNPRVPKSYTLVAHGVNGDASAVVQVNIASFNRGPVAIAQAPASLLDHAANDDGTGMLVGSNSYDPDEDPITYRWRSTGRLKATILDPTAANPTFSLEGGPGSYEFELMVTDHEGAMSFDTAVVSWTAESEQTRSTPRTSISRRAP